MITMALLQSSAISVNKSTKMAGMAGIEPANDGTKTRCLTTWRHPSVPQLYHKNTKKPPKQMSLGGSRSKRLFGRISAYC